MRTTTTFSLIFALLCHTQLAAGNNLLMNFGSTANSADNFKNCNEFTKVHAVSMFHDHIWPKVGKAGSKYEVTNCLEKTKAHAAGHSDYEIIVQMGDKTCSFKLKYDSSKPIDQRVLLNDIEEEIKLCSSELKAHAEEPKYFTKPIIDAWYEEIKYPELTMHTETFFPAPGEKSENHVHADIEEKPEEKAKIMRIQLDEPVTNHGAPFNEAQSETKYITLPAIEPVTEHHTYYMEDFRNEEAPTMHIQLDEPVTEYKPSSNEAQSEMNYITLPTIEPVNEYHTYHVEDFRNEEAPAMHIQLDEPVTEYKHSSNEAQSEMNYITLPTIEPVNEYHPYPGEILEENTEWENCSKEQRDQVADNMISLISANILHSFIIYVENLVECKAAKNESRFLYSLSFNFKVCKFHIAVKEGEATLINHLKLKSDDCKVHLKETARGLGNLLSN